MKKIGNINSQLLQFIKINILSQIIIFSSFAFSFFQIPNKQGDHQLWPKILILFLTQRVCVSSSSERKLSLNPSERVVLCNLVHSPSETDV